MKKEGYYSSGEFAKMAHVTVRTIRYYDKQNILKPSLVTESGARFYTDKDFTRLQQILLLKYLGFSLDDIKELTIGDCDYHFLLESLTIQLQLIRDRMEQLQLVEKALMDTSSVIRAQKKIDWNQMLHLIHLTNIEEGLKNQYQNASNITSRIHLHTLYAQNSVGWFPWILKQCNLKEGFRVLELGCGDGSLWKGAHLPKPIHITLSDLSKGMVRDARRALVPKRSGKTANFGSPFRFRVFDAHSIPFSNSSFDIVIANHMLFYCSDIDKVCSEVKRVLTKNGMFLCSTYGQNHMIELTNLVRQFDSRIVLSADKLYERFGKENGKGILQKHFSKVTWRQYEDSLFVPDVDPIVSYILSCHGNQNQYILNRYQDFRDFTKEKIKDGLHITKDAGLFLCQNEVRRF